MFSLALLFYFSATARLIFSLALPEIFLVFCYVFGWIERSEN